VIATYSLREDIASFNFFYWLVRAKAAGATEIAFHDERPKDSKWNHGTVLRRYHTILQPGCALAGLPYRTGALWRRFDASPHFTEFCAWARSHEFERLRSVLPPGKERYTITLRRTERAPRRNSNEPAWRAFAQEIGARVIEDEEVEHIGLHERLALYAGAEMNFFVTNGPGALCQLTDYPSMTFACWKSEGTFNKAGIFRGDGLPWKGPHTLVWDDDDLDTIRREWRDRR
jgi:hypothetical protein